MELTRTCPRCLKEKPVAAFSRRGKKGRQSWCKECVSMWRIEHPQETAQHKKNRVEGGYWRKYHQSEKGIINGLVNKHNYPKEEAEKLAPLLLDPEARCGICGVPNKVLRALVRQNFSFPLGSTIQNRRLTPDNLDPGKPHTLRRTRLLCRGCNSRRGANKLSDRDTLSWARRNWQQRLPQKLLLWLRTEPEIPNPDGPLPSGT